jgi:hypothetical protein
LSAHGYRAHMPLGAGPRFHWPKFLWVFREIENM